MTLVIFVRGIRKQITTTKNKSKLYMGINSSHLLRSHDSYWYKQIQTLGIRLLTETENGEPWNLKIFLNFRFVSVMSRTPQSSHHLRFGETFGSLGLDGTCYPYTPKPWKSEGFSSLKYGWILRGTNQSSKRLFFSPVRPRPTWTSPGRWFWKNLRGPSGLPCLSKITWNTPEIERIDTHKLPIPIGSMGMVYLPTFTVVDFFMVNVGKYTIHWASGHSLKNTTNCQINLT